MENDDAKEVKGKNPSSLKLSSPQSQKRNVYCVNSQCVCVIYVEYITFVWCKYVKMYYCRGWWWWW